MRPYQAYDSSYFTLMQKITPNQSSTHTVIIFHIMLLLNPNTFGMLFARKLLEIICCYHIIFAFAVTFLFDLNQISYLFHLYLNCIINFAKNIIAEVEVSKAFQGKKNNLSHSNKTIFEMFYKVQLTRNNSLSIEL